MKCVICKDTIQPELSGWREGHNALPVKAGRCCTVCNDVYVIPKRISNLMKGMKNGKDKSETA